MSRREKTLTRSSGLTAAKDWMKVVLMTLRQCKCTWKLGMNEFAERKTPLVATRSLVLPFGKTNEFDEVIYQLLVIPHVRLAKLDRPIYASHILFGWHQ